MNSRRHIIIGALAMGFLSALFNCKDRSNAAPVNPPVQYQQADIYRDLRGQMLAIRPDAVGVAAGSDEPLAVLMETGYPEAVATLVCVADGSASLYFSNGGGVIGGGEHEAVNAAARSLVAASGTFRAAFEPTTAYPLPDVGRVRFYVVTRSGVLAAPQAVEDDLGNMREQLSPLFHQAHEVISAIREHAPQ